MSEALNLQPLLGRCAVGAGQMPGWQSKILWFYFLCFTLYYFYNLANIIIYRAQWGKLHRNSLTGSHHGVYVHPFTLQVTGNIFQWTRNIPQQSAMMTMVAAPAASEEMSPNETIMAYLDHNSHSSLTFSFTSHGVLYSRNTQKCKTSFKNKWA